MSTVIKRSFKQKRPVRSSLKRMVFCHVCNHHVVPVKQEVRDYEDYQGSSWFVGYTEIEVCPQCNATVFTRRRNPAPLGQADEVLVEDIALF